MSREDNKKQVIHVPKLGADFVRVHSHLWHMHRSLTYKTHSDEFDIMGRYWCFSVANGNAGQCGFWQDGKVLPMEGRVGIFLPALSLVRWRFAPGVVSFDSFFSIEELPTWAPKEPQCFLLSNAYEPESPASIFELLREEQDRGMSLSFCSKPNSLARKTKQLIDTTFTDELPLSEIAKTLGVSLTLLGRYFKRAYDLTPVNYRNRLRVRDAMRAILFSDRTITDIGLDAGFKDTSQFNRNFQKIANYQPSTLRFRSAPLQPEH